MIRYDFLSLLTFLSALKLDDLLAFMPQSESVRDYCHKGIYAVLGGQSVSSAIMRLLNIGDGPINDYDIFIGYDLPAKSSQMNARRKAEGDKETGISGDYNDWYDNATDDSGLPYYFRSSPKLLTKLDDSPIQDTRMYRYKINKTEIEDKLNLVYINYDYPIVSSHHFALKTIQGVDINCCQVGVDLQTGSLVYTDAFIEFLLLRKLKVVTAFTPVNTAFRLLRKECDLRDFASVNMNLEFQMLGAMLLCNTTRVSTRFGIHTWNKNSNAIKINGADHSVADGRFRLVAATLHEMPLWTLKVMPKFEREIRSVLESGLGCATTDDDEFTAPLILERLASSPNTYPDNFRLLFGAETAIQRDKKEPHRIVRHSLLRGNSSDEVDAILLEE